MVWLTWTPLSYLMFAIKYRRTRSTTDNVNKYIPQKCKTTTYQKCFLVRACRIWNRLVDGLNFSLATLTSFNSVLFNYYKTSLVTSFDCEDPRTFKIVCLKCNSVRLLSRPILCCMWLISFFFVLLSFLTFHTLFILSGPAVIGLSCCGSANPLL